MRTWDNTIVYVYCVPYALYCTSNRIGRGDVVVIGISAVKKDTRTIVRPRFFFFFPSFSRPKHLRPRFFTENFPPKCKEIEIRLRLSKLHRLRSPRVQYIRNTIRRLYTCALHYNVFTGVVVSTTCATQTPPRVYPAECRVKRFPRCPPVPDRRVGNVVWFITRRRNPFSL